MRRRWVISVLFSTACWGCMITGVPASDDESAVVTTSSGTTSTSSASAGGGGSTSVSAGSGASGGAGAGDPGLPPVTWIDWPSQQTRTGSAWGTALTDIAVHLPSSYGTTYDDPDLVTFGHETSHGIHAHLRNYENNTGAIANAFYVLGNKAAIVEEPNIRKSDIAPYVPQSLREFRYGTYVTGASSWDDRPLYIWDEWNAYVNGAEVGINRVSEGLWTEGWRDQSGNFEFVVYAMALGHCVSENDPTFFADNEQFKAFLRWNTERAMALFQQHRSMTEFQSDNVDAYFQTFKTASDAAPLRTFIQDTYGAAWAAATLEI